MMEHDTMKGPAGKTKRVVRQVADLILVGPEESCITGTSLIIENRQTLDGRAPLPQQTAAGTPQRPCPTRVAAAATASGLAPRRLLAERTEVPEQSITTYRTRRCIRVIMQVPKLRHEQRPEVPELKETLP